MQQLEHINLTSQSTSSPTPGPYAKFHKKSPEFNPDPTKALLPFVVLYA